MNGSLILKVRLYPIIGIRMRLAPRIQRTTRSKIGLFTIPFGTGRNTHRGMIRIIALCASCFIIIRVTRSLKERPGASKRSLRLTSELLEPSWQSGTQIHLGRSVNGPNQKGGSSCRRNYPSANHLINCKQFFPWRKVAEGFLSASATLGFM